MKYTLTTAALALMAWGFCSGEAQATFHRHHVNAEQVRLVRYWYQKYLGRDADPAGLQVWSTELSKGRNAEAGIIGSQEYYVRYGATPESFAYSLYINVLSREPSPAEVGGWCVRLQQLRGDRVALARDFLKAAGIELAQRGALPPVAPPTFQLPAPQPLPPVPPGNPPPFTYPYPR